MVKRAKLTLEHTEAKAHVEEIKEADFPEPVANEQTVSPDRRDKLAKMLILAGLTITSLIIFKQKIF